MIRSMTGFAEKKFESKSLSVKITIKSLNHRFFDWSYRGPNLGEMENKLRALCQKKVYRGRVEVLTEMVFHSPQSWETELNIGLAEKVISALKNLAESTGEKVSFTADQILNLPYIMEIKRKDFDEKEKKFLERGFGQTCDSLIRDRNREGQEIKKELRRITRNILMAVRRLKKLQLKQPSMIKEKVSKNLKELEKEMAVSEERKAEVIAGLLQRYDLTEEVVRLDLHGQHLQSSLSSKNNEPVGKKLDFIAQELYREANTINSKSQDISITRESLFIKNEVEALRQQAQNVE